MNEPRRRNVLDGGGRLMKIVSKRSPCYDSLEENTTMSIIVLHQHNSWNSNPYWSLKTMESIITYYLAFV